MHQSTAKPELDFQSQLIEINQIPNHYLESGVGDPILFLHGVPACAWIWCDLFPYLNGLGRCLALDLVGFGQSGKPNTNYSLTEQIQFVEKFIEKLNLKNITLVLQGWGSIIGLSIAMKYPEKIKGLVFYEAWLAVPQNEFLSLPYQEYIGHWQAEQNVSSVMTNGIQFVNQTLKQIAMQQLDENSLAHYCAPFAQTGSGKSLHQYLLDAPSGDGKSLADEIINEYSKKLLQSKLPKLLLYSIPGFITTIESLIWAKNNLTNLEVSEVGEDFHFAPQSNANLMGETISIWLQGLEATL